MSQSPNVSETRFTAERNRIAGPTPDGRLLADATEWICRETDGGRTLARCITTRNELLESDGVRTGLIGWYEPGQNDDAGIFLLSMIRDQLCSEGTGRLLGPIDHDTWHHYRAPFPSDTPPFFMDVTTPPRVAQHFSEAGFIPVETYYSTEQLLDVAEETAIDRLQERLEQEGITVRAIDIERIDSEIGHIHRIADEAFRANPFYTTIPEADVRALYTPLVPLLDPEFALMVEDDTGEPIAFFLGFEDRTRPPGDTIVLKSIGILPSWQGRGIGTLLMGLVHRSAGRRGYRTAIHALMHEKNYSTRILPNGEIIRRYALFGYDCGAKGRKA